MMRKLLVLAILLLCVTEGNGQICRFGPGCQYDCNCAGNCDPQTGCVGSCTRGWDGPTCQRRNLAMDQRTSQSSTWQPQYIPELAVDGKVGHDVLTTPCTHTQPDSQSWWMVTLDKTYSIYRFQIYNRIGNCDLVPYVPCGARLNGFTLSVGTNSQGYSTCYTDTTTSTYGPGDIINGTCNDSDPRTGNTIRISLPAGSNTSLSLCEVRLFVCNPGWYGPDCAEECGFCYQGRSSCDRISGYCEMVSGQPLCIAGYTSAHCKTQCKPGWYGRDCAEKCGFCSQGRSSCNKVSGNCQAVIGQPRCMTGYTGVNCKTECMSYKWGPDCANNCGQCPGKAVCDRVTGECPPCSEYKWGPNCEKTCGQCRGGAVCDGVTGECPPGNPRCVTGYTGPLCTLCSTGSWGDNCVNTCSENCISAACNVTTGACEGGCHPGYTGERCDADCPTGSWGDNCVSTCSDNCLEQPCNVQTGACEGGCQPGYAGKFCETEFSVTSVDYTNVIIGCVVGVTMTAVLVTAVVLYVRKRQTGRSEGTAVSAENTGVTQDVSQPEPSNRTQGQHTDPSTYYNMTSEEHPYETVPQKEYDKMRFSRLDTDTKYTTLT